MITVHAVTVNDGFPWVYLHFANEADRQQFQSQFPRLDLATYGCCGLSLRGRTITGLKMTIAHSGCKIIEEPELFFTELFVTSIAR